MSWFSKLFGGGEKPKSDESSKWVVLFAVSYRGRNQDNWPDYIDKVRNAGLQLEPGADWINVDHSSDAQDQTAQVMRFRADCPSKEGAQAAAAAFVAAGACDARVVRW